ncbi:hypothetical protein A0H81_09444 [Grifola frondosa]|uniref:C2H2-type domain-containing protein n=1 Tax=Grifola frondosa TaxID=5627 RepID=A0A1C7M0V1_GRIFR|nr:hypothetical protein A0H81_09444 [Grifola frondosa]
MRRHLSAPTVELVVNGSPDCEDPQSKVLKVVTVVQTRLQGSGAESLQQKIQAAVLRVMQETDEDISAVHVPNSPLSQCKLGPATWSSDGSGYSAEEDTDMSDGESEVSIEDTDATPDSASVTETAATEESYADDINNNRPANDDEFSSGWTPLTLGRHGKRQMSPDMEIQEDEPMKRLRTSSEGYRDESDQNEPADNAQMNTAPGQPESSVLYPPHSCLLIGCTFVASDARARDRHMDTHFDLKRFECPNCKESWRRGDILQKHFRKNNECDQAAREQLGLPGSATSIDPSSFTTGLPAWKTTAHIAKLREPMSSDRFFSDWHRLRRDAGLQGPQ